MKTYRWLTLIAAALIAVLEMVVFLAASSTAHAASPAPCDMRLSIKLTPDVPNPREAGFLSSLRNNQPGYRLTLQQQGNRSVIVLDYRLLIPDGSVKHLQVVARALADGSGHVEFVGAVMDVTQRKRAEEVQRLQERERAEMQRQLQQAAKMEAIGRLAGGIAHDFNNILGAILGYGELAQNRLAEGGAVRRHVDQVMQAGARGKGLVDRILAFSRSGMGERMPLHVQSVIEETLELLAASLPVEMRLERHLDALDAAVVGDATQLHQVTMNLCTNAVHAMAQGSVLTVLLDCVAAGERRLFSHGTLGAGRYVRLSVSDTGTGIPPAVLERMSIRSSPPNVSATARALALHWCTA